jgi:hypothetical protein
VISPLNGGNSNVGIKTCTQSSAQRWVIEPATTLGAPGGYRNVRLRDDINCLGYALKKADWPNISINAKEGVQDVYPRVEAYVKNTLGRGCRKLSGKDDYIRPSE